jgi:hypothetical protein
MQIIVESILFKAKVQFINQKERQYKLDSILTGARKVSVKKPKPGNANHKPFERIMIMEYELTEIGKIKMTVGVRRRTLEKVQYCITAISSE